MKVRIQNDGNIGYMTRVTDVKTDELLEYVTHVDINIDVKEMVTAKITTVCPVIDVIADADILNVCPCCGKEKSDARTTNRPATTKEAAPSARSSARLD